MFKNAFVRPLYITAGFLCLCLLVISRQQAAQQNPISGQSPQNQQEPKPTPTPTPPPSGNLSSTQQIRDQDDPNKGINIRTEVVSLTVTVTDPYNRLVTGLDKQHFEI